MNNTAIIVEYDYKGEYIRFALTRTDFATQCEEAPTPTFDGDSYTLACMEHIWYKEEVIGSEFWNEFFTNMEWGLAESDLESGNLAYVDNSRSSEILRKYICA